MQKIILCLSIGVFCALAPLHGARAQTSDADLFIQLQVLLEQITELQALLGRELGEYSYDAGDEFSVTYESFDEFDVYVELDPAAKFWLFSAHENDAIGVAVLGEFSYELALEELDELEAEVAYELENNEFSDVEIIDAEPGFQSDVNDFDTKKISWIEDGVHSGILLAKREIRSSSQEGAVVVITGWGGYNPYFPGDYFLSEEEAERVFNDFIRMDISERAMLAEIEDIDYDDWYQGDATQEYGTDDVSIELSLSSIVFAAELYYYDNEESFAGICQLRGTEYWYDVKDIVQVLDADCDDNARGFAVSAELSDGMHYCVDSQGVAVVTDEPKGENDTDCPRVSGGNGNGFETRSEFIGN